MRWLRPPPAATAAFSSSRRPGVVLRVSRIARAGAGDRLDEARGQRRDAGEVAEEVERGPLGRQQRRAPGRWPAAPRPARPRATAPRPRGCRRPRPRTAASPRRPRPSPKTTPGCFCTIRARARASAGTVASRGHVAGADVLGQRPRDELLIASRSLDPSRARLDQRRVHLRRSLAIALRRPANAAQRSSGRGIASLTFGPAAAFNPRGDRTAPVPDPARRARRRRDGGAARRGRARRRRGLLPGDLPGRPARLPEARATAATCAAGC